MNNPLVSIIIPTFNRAHLIGETLDSVLAQIYENWECIIVDDGSTDNSSEIIGNFVKKDSRFQYYHRPQNRRKGANACRNYGVEKSKSEYLIFLDSDDRLLDYCLQNRIAKTNEFPDYCFWIFPMFVEEKNGGFVEKEITYQQNYLIEFLSYRLQWQTMSTLWNKDFFIKISGFDESLPRLNDPDIHIKAMVLSQTNFKVFNKGKPDTIYFPNILNDHSKFATKFFQSLLLFIPTISKLLVENKKRDHLKYLKNYLFQYLYTSSQFTSIKNNMKLIKTFHSSSVIYYNEYFYLLILIILNAGVKKVNKKIESKFKSILKVYK